jgi:hypothetical protein
MATVYEIVPAGTKPFYLLIPVLVLLLGVVLLLGWTLYGTQRASLTLSTEGIAFRGDIWGRKTIPMHRIRTGDARMINLETETQLIPVSRRMGTGLPGYSSGWFRLRSGEKALVYLTDRRKVVYLPTDLGYSILTSVAEPERLLSELRSIP